MLPEYFFIIQCPINNNKDMFHPPYMRETTLHNVSASDDTITSKQKDILYSIQHKQC